MAYKSNRQARAEYLENEARNRERNARDYAHRKSRGGSRKIALAILALILIVWYLSPSDPEGRAFH
jgi:hypothetical protein